MHFSRERKCPNGHSLYFCIVQVDIFSIEAVSLGKLKKVLISHNGIGPGKISFLGKKFVLKIY